MPLLDVAATSQAVALYSKARLHEESESYLLVVAESLSSLYSRCRILITIHAESGCQRGFDSFIGRGFPSHS